MPRVFSLIAAFTVLLVFVHFVLRFTNVSRDRPVVTPTCETAHVMSIFKHVFPALKKKHVDVTTVILVFLVHLVSVSNGTTLTRGKVTPVPLFFINSLDLIRSFLHVYHCLIVNSVVID